MLLFKDNKMKSKTVTMNKLPKSKSKLGYTSEELEVICKKAGVSNLEFIDALGINTCAFYKGTVYYYKCDVEKAVYILGKKCGKFHTWD